VPSITTPKQLQRAFKLGFCYLCGQPFAPGDRLNRDHVPPSACFAVKDRAVPLVLPTHLDCNAARGVGDERIGQLVSLKHRGMPPKDKFRLNVSTVWDAGRQKHQTVVSNIDIRGEVERWLRGFHAALYGQPLPSDAMFAIETPFPRVVPTRDGAVAVADPFRERQHLLFVRTIKDNRAARNVDRIATNNGKLLYECVWDQANNGSWMCIFGFDLYQWKDLGNVHDFRARGCAGCYQHPSGEVPPLATKAMRLLVELPNADPLDPFAR
jgi:hypothetical protein